MQNDVKVESGNVVSYDDVRVQLADLGQKEPQEGPLRVHLVHLGDRRLLSHDLLKVERPHLVRGSGHGAEVGGERGLGRRPVQVETRMYWVLSQVLHVLAFSQLQE